MRASIILISAATLLLSRQAAEGQNPPTRGTPSVAFDLGSTSIAGVLPFDQPFVLTGPAAPSLQRVVVVYGAMSEAELKACTPVAADLNKKGGATGTSAKKCWHETWQRQSAANDSIRLKIVELKPNESYGFSVSTESKLSPEDSTRFVNSVRGLVQKRSREWVLQAIEIKDVSDRVLRAFANELRSALLATTGTRLKVTISASSILAEHPTDESIGSTFASLANPQCDRLRLARQMDLQATVRPSSPSAPPELSLCPGAAAAVLGADGSTFATDLDTLAKDPALGAFIEALQYVPDARLSQVKVRAAIAALSRLRSARANDVSEVAYGRGSIDNPRAPVAGIANPKKNISTFAELAPWRDNLATTAERVDDIIVAISILRGPIPSSVSGEARTRAGEGAKAAAAIEPLIRRAYENVRRQQDNVRQFATALEKLEAAGDAIARQVIPSQLASIALEGTTFGSFATRARWHISQEIGVLYGEHPDDVRAVEPYAGINIYFRPVNRSAHVGVACAFTEPGKCLSLTLGMSISTLIETDRFKGVIGGKAAIAGVGARIGDFLRVSYLRPFVYTASEEQPRRQRVASLHAVAISIDAELKDVLGAIGRSLFP